MKRLLPFLLIASFTFSSFSTKPPKKLLGYWIIQSMELEGETLPDGGIKYWDFQKEGILEGGEIGEAPDLFGTWSYDKKRNIIDMDITEGVQLQGTFAILNMNKSEMSLRYGPLTMNFVRREK